MSEGKAAGLSGMILGAKCQPMTFFCTSRPNFGVQTTNELGAVSLSFFKPTFRSAFGNHLTGLQNSTAGNVNA